MRISTGKGEIGLLALLAIWSVSAVTSLPGLAVSPVLEDLSRIFPSASELEVQMLSSLPSLLIIPFVMLAGWFASANRDTQEQNCFPYSGSAPSYRLFAHKRDARRLPNS